jgi:polysaccharide export outer membrane protein
MNVKTPLFLIAIISLAFYFIVSGGCTTADTKSEAPIESASSVSEVAIKEIKITEFILGPGDKVEIMVYRHDDLKRTVQIDTSGKITYPLIGDFQAAGLSIFQLRDKIRDGLLKYIIDPQVSVGVTAVQSQKVIVLGEVDRPGLFSLDIPMTALDVISKAGGFTKDAKQKSILLIRGSLEKPQLITLNIDKFFNDYDMTQNVYLRDGDILYVPATFIADVARFFDHLYSIIRPMVQLENAYWIGQQIESGGRAVAVTSP